MRQRESHPTGLLNVLLNFVECFAELCEILESQPRSLWSPQLLHARPAEMSHIEFAVCACALSGGGGVRGVCSLQPAHTCDRVVHMYTQTSKRLRPFRPRCHTTRAW